VVVDTMRGDWPRNRFLSKLVGYGVRAMHAEAKKNTPSIIDTGEPTLGLAALRQEGEAFYYDPETGERVQALIDRLAF
jgi:hypothetical protein